MITHRRSGLLISKFALSKFFRYLINCAGGGCPKSIKKSQEKIDKNSFLGFFNDF